MERAKRRVSGRDPYEGWRWKLKQWQHHVFDWIAGRWTLWRWRRYINKRTPDPKGADIIEIEAWKSSRKPNDTKDQPPSA